MRPRGPRLKSTPDQGEDDTESSSSFWIEQVPLTFWACCLTS